MNFLPFLLPLLLFVIVLYKHLFSTSTRDGFPPPSPPKLPIIGHLHKLGKHLPRNLQALSNQHGSLMLLHFGSTPTLVASSPNAARQILKTHDAVLSNRPFSVMYAKLLYNGRDLASAPYGEYWKQMKSFFVFQLLSNKKVRSYQRIREEETSVLIENVMESGNVVNLSDLFTRFTYEVSCKVALGGKYSDDPKRNADFRDFLTEFNDLLGLFDLGDFIPWMGWINKFNGLNKRLNNAFNKLDNLIEEIIREHFESQNGDKTKDFVDVLLEVQREKSLGFEIEKDSIKALIVDAFAAGTHPTAAMLEWEMAELLRNPTVMNTLQTEIRSIVGEKDIITKEDLENMKYLKAVVKETLRLHPPAPLLIPRESTQKLKINGYDVAPKTRVIINAWAIQRDPKTWYKPEEFRPQRFLNSTVDFKGRDFELIPFGGGRRICPAVSFAEASNALALAKLMYKFNWSLPDGAAGHTLDMSEDTGLSVRMKNPLLATATATATDTDTATRVVVVIGKEPCD